MSFMWLGQNHSRADLVIKAAFGCRANAAETGDNCPAPILSTVFVLAIAGKYDVQVRYPGLKSHRCSDFTSCTLPCSQHCSSRRIYAASVVACGQVYRRAAAPEPWADLQITATVRLCGEAGVSLHVSVVGLC